MADWQRISVIYDAESEEGRKIHLWRSEQPNVSDSIRRLILGQPLLINLQREIDELKKIIGDVPQREMFGSQSPDMTSRLDEFKLEPTEEALVIGIKKGASQFFEE